MTLPIDPSLFGLFYAGDIGDITIYRSKRGKVVAFAKTWPVKEATPRQYFQRLRFRAAMQTWQSMHPSDQEDYERVVQKLSLCLTGMNLWIKFCLKPDPALFQTLQRQAGVILVSPVKL